MRNLHKYILKVFQQKFLLTIYLHKIQFTVVPDYMKKSSKLTITRSHLLNETTATILRPFSRTTRVSWCQKKASSGLYGAREDNMRQTH